MRQHIFTLALAAVLCVGVACGCGEGNIKGQNGPTRGMGTGPEPEEQGPKNAGSMDNGLGSTGTTGAPSNASGR